MARTFINSGRKEVYEKLVEEDKTFEEAYERLKKASSDEKLMAMYRSREKAIRDWNDSINSARREGELQGKRIGLQEGIQTGQIELWLIWSMMDFLILRRLQSEQG